MAALRVLLLLIVVAVVAASGTGTGTVAMASKCDSCSPNDAVNHHTATGTIKGFRPHGGFARIIYDKQRADERLYAYDKKQVSVAVTVTVIVDVRHAASRRVATRAHTTTSCTTSLQYYATALADTHSVVLGQRPNRLRDDARRAGTRDFNQF